MSSGLRAGSAKATKLKSGKLNFLWGKGGSKLQAISVRNYEMGCNSVTVSYSEFHKTLPKSSLQMHWISVRFYEMGDTRIF